MNTKLVIIGAGGHGKVVLDIARISGRWTDIKFLDDDPSIKSVSGIDVIGPGKDFVNYLSDHDVIVAIGNNKDRRDYFKIVEKQGASIPTMIHPKTTISEDVEIGKGTIIVAGVIINTHSTIGKGCIINTASTIGHDNLIGDFVHIAPGSTLSGTVNVRKSSWVGSGSVISNNIKITSNCVIAAGAVVVKDIEERGTYGGVPARKLK